MSSDGRDDLGPGYHNEERARRLDSLIQVARVVESDPQKGLKVQYGDGSTGYLPQAKLRSKGKRTWDRHQVGEQVVVFAPSGELGNAFVWGSIAYDDPKTQGQDASNDKQSTQTKDVGDKNDVDITEWPDGTIHTYDHVKKEHTFHLTDDAKATTFCKKATVYHDKNQVKTTVQDDNGKKTSTSIVTKDKIEHTQDDGSGVKSVTTILSNLIKHTVGDKVSTTLSVDSILHQVEEASVSVNKDQITHKVNDFFKTLDKEGNLIMKLKSFNVKAESTSFDSASTSFSNPISGSFLF